MPTLEQIVSEEKTSKRATVSICKDEIVALYIQHRSKQVSEKLFIYSRLQSI